MKPRHLIPTLLCALLIGYPLSVGPAAMFLAKAHPGEFTPWWFLVFYEPLSRASLKVPFFGKVHGWYMNFWIPSDGADCGVAPLE